MLLAIRIIKQINRTNDTINKNEVCNIDVHNHCHSIIHE